MLNGISHEWVNKQMGIKVPDYPFLKEGKEAHRIIQEHVLGRKIHPDLKNIKVHFPLVEEKDFDERLAFSFFITFDEDEYEIRGFYDGLDLKNGRILEIKSSSNPWSLSKFQASMQRKIYGLSNINLKEAYLITCAKNVDKWKYSPPKLLSVPYTEKDREEADGWIIEGIETLRDGKFTGGLDENGKCTGCFYNMLRYPELANCHFL